MNWRAARKGASSLDLLYRAAYSLARPGTAGPRLALHRWLEAMSPIEVIQTEKRDLDKAPSASESDVSIISKERWVGANLTDIEGRVPDGGKSPGTRWVSLA